jgi:O-antigen/teichoic acid export membrane protein
MNIAKSSLKLSLAHGATAITTFVGITVFANQLSPSSLGVYFLVEALVGVLTIPADLGIRGAAEKRISEGNEPAKILSAALLLKLLPLAVILTGVVAFAGTVNEYVGAPVALFLFFAIIGHELYHSGVQLISGELRVGETAVLRLSHRMTWFSVGYLLVHYGYGVDGVLIGLLLSYLVPFVWAMRKRTTSLRKPSMGEYRSLTSYSKYNFVSAVSGYFYSWMDILFIGYFLASAYVGAYEVAWRVTAVVVLGSQAISQTIFPQVSRWDANEAKERIEELIPQAITPSLLLAVPALYGALLFSREILTYVFGQGYTLAWLALVILMAEKVLQSVHVIIGRSLKAIDRPDLAAKAAAAAILTNFVLNLVLVWRFQLPGAAVATTVSFALNTFLCKRYLSRHIQVKIPWQEVFWIGCAATGMAVVLFGVEAVVDISSLTRLLAVIVFGAILYVGFLLLVPTFRRKAFAAIDMVLAEDTQTDSVGSEDG